MLAVWGQAVSKQGVQISVQINDRCLLAQTMLVGWYFKQKTVVSFFFYSGIEIQLYISLCRVSSYNFLRKKKINSFSNFVKLEKLSGKKNEQSQTSYI